MRQGGSNFYLKINIGQHHLFSWSSEFAQYLQDYLMDEHYSWYSGSFEGLKSVPEYLIVRCLVYDVDDDLLQEVTFSWRLFVKFGFNWSDEAFRKCGPWRWTTDVCIYFKLNNEPSAQLS